MTTNVIEIAINATETASGVLGKTGTAVGKLTGLVLAGGAAAVGTAIGFSHLVKSMNEAADEAARMSIRLGISAEELTALQGAAELSDLSLDSLHRNLGLLNQNLARMAIEGGTANAVMARDRKSVV